MKETAQCDEIGRDSIGDRGYLHEVVSAGPRVEELRPT